MSNKEKIISLLDAVPESKMGYILAYVQGITVDVTQPEEIIPDDWDLKMIREAEKSNDGKTVSLEELLAKDGLTYADLQN